MFELEAVDRMLGMQPRHAKAPFDRAAVARVEFEVGERLQRLREAHILTGRIGDHLIELAAHRRQTELIEFQMERGH